MHKIYLKSQHISDLRTSYKWRNDSSIWSKTVGEGKFKLKKIKDEIEWFKNRKNISIFLENNKLVGNIYYIKNKTAQFQIVIGNKNYWNKGIRLQNYL